MMVGVERVLEYVNETPSEEEEGAQVEDVKVEVKFDDNHHMNMPNWRSNGADVKQPYWLFKTIGNFDVFVEILTALWKW